MTYRERGLVARKIFQ